MTFNAFEIVFLLIIFTGLFGGFVAWTAKFQPIITAFLKAAPYYLINIYAKYVVFAILLSIVLIILLIIYLMRENSIRSKMMNKVLPSAGVKISDKKVDVILENPKWKIVQEHINSEDASKWKLAILEADIILSELLDGLQLKGEGVGEKLKTVESSDFEHIEEAWEAHKIRNAIAHQGSDFLLTKDEAHRIIKLYQSVFEEFEVI